ncbi:MAG: hypothetical protein WC979_05455 [Candidatus Pacearchaeota archaeon]|jgi:hypothetical protein
MERDFYHELISAHNDPLKSSLYFILERDKMGYRMSRVDSCIEAKSSVLWEERFGLISLDIDK